MSASPEGADSRVRTSPGLTSVLAAIEIRSAEAFTFPSAATTPMAGPTGTVSATARSRLETALRNRLYSAAFARPWNGSEVKEVCEPPATAEIVRRLRQANRGRQRWLMGWRIDGVKPDGEITASRNGQSLSVRPGAYALTFSETLRPRAGAGVILRATVESLTLQAGVYTAFGETLPSAEDAEPALRLYLSVPTELWAGLYGRLTGELNQRQVPFTLKSMVKPSERDRLDSTVLYLPRRFRNLIDKVPGWLPSSLRQAMAPEVPLFTIEVAPGMGFAESPGNGESFGMHRCRLLAEGVVEAWLAGHQDARRRRAAVAERFGSVGLDLDLPHLAPADGRALLPAPAEKAPPTKVALSSAADEAVRSCVERAWLPSGLRWQVTDFSRRNRNWIVRALTEEGEVFGPGYFLKELRVQGAESRSMLEREAAIYRLAAHHSVFTPLAPLLPAFHGFDRASGRLLLGLVGKGKSLANHQRREEVDLEASAAAFGRALGRLHREVRPPTDFDPQHRLFPRQAPGIFTVHRGGPLVAWLGSAQLKMVRDFCRAPELAALLDGMADRWRFSHLIHGDVKWENALLDLDGEVRLVDWELADLGDPAWDVGSALQAWWAEEIRQPARRFALQDAATAFQRAYEEAAGLAARDAEDLHRRSLICAVARLLQSALEEQHRLAAGSTDAPPEGSLPLLLVERALSKLPGIQTL